MFINLYTGSFFLWGNIAIYVLSYYHPTDTSMSYNFIFMVDSYMILANWLGNLLGTFLFQNKILSVKGVLSIGGISSILGVFLSSFASDIYTFLFFYSGM